MIFFVLPYITDIPYLDDQTPTQDAEENSKVETKAETGHENIFPVVAYVQIDSVVGHGFTPQDIYKRISYPIRGTPPVQLFCLASLISRAPPVA